MKKGMLVGMGVASAVLGLSGYMLYKNMNTNTKRGVKKAMERKTKKMTSAIDNMM